ncbi:MAG TPA: hypothetical protein VM118_15475, partial [Acidobacteriota bacterium]|nr:hypothetical protein [Acidobacteriota bacterium]
MTRNTRSATGITTTPSPVTIPEPAAELIDAAVTQSDREGRAVFLTGTGPAPAGDPLGWLSAQTRLPRVYWRTPDGVELAGAGGACAIRAARGSPVFRAADAATDILRNRTIRAISPESSLERFLGGFAFEPEEETDPL